jgi:hypothetical protein
VLYNNKYLILLFLLSFSGFSQSKLNNYLKPSDTLSRSKLNTVIIAEATLASATLIGLNQLWYADYEKSKFQTINDNSEWLQMDKLGHVYSSYQLGRIGATALKWSGTNKKNQLLYGGTLGFVFFGCS